MSLTKAKFNALGKVFAAEIEDRLPFQSKAQVYTFLEEDGLVRKDSRVFGAGERFPVTVEGWALTRTGHLEYCLACAK